MRNKIKEYRAGLESLQWLFIFGGTCEIERFRRRKHGRSGLRIAVGAGFIAKRDGAFVITERAREVFATDFELWELMKAESPEEKWELAREFERHAS